jgi:hypothetical protein
MMRATVAISSGEGLGARRPALICSSSHAAAIFAMSPVFIACSKGVTQLKPSGTECAHLLLPADLGQGMPLDDTGQVPNEMVSPAPQTPRAPGHSREPTGTAAR